MPNRHGYYLKQIFFSYPIEDYDWVIDLDQTEAYVLSAPLKPLFQNNHINGPAFKELIEQYSYLVFLNIQCFTEEAKTENNEKYPLFQLLLFDSSFVEIVSNSVRVLEGFKQNAQNNHYNNIEICKIGQ